MYLILFVFIGKFAWILVKRSIFVGIILRIICRWIYKEFLERIIKRYKTIIIDLRLKRTRNIFLTLFCLKGLKPVDSACDC